jgi:hypothetical protein
VPSKAVGGRIKGAIVFLLKNKKPSCFKEDHLEERRFFIGLASLDRKRLLIVKHPIL